MELFFFASRVASTSLRNAWKFIAAAGVLTLLSTISAFGQTTPTVSCESLAKLALPYTTITMAQTVAAGEFKIPKNTGGPQFLEQSATQAPIPAFCRVAATLKPTIDSEIKMEVWLPLSDWNGKFLGVGGAGFAGNISYTGNAMGLMDAVRRNYAAASTDTGHEASATRGGEFILGHPEKLIDYAYRAVHEMTVKSKAIVMAYYGVPARYSYFIGCSLGGRQALVEAQRFPEDYDGIVAGAPSNPKTLQSAAQIWPAWLISKDPARFIPASKYTMIHEAAIKACATPVGINDGLIEEPDRCHFDPQVLSCKGAEGPDCLTTPQVDLMRQIYAGPVDPRTKESIFPGVPVGGELELPEYAGEEPHGSALDIYRYAMYQDPDWDWRKLDYGSDVAQTDKVLGPLINASPDLKSFVDRGGKLMIYIGWTDSHNPVDVALYYHEVLKRVGNSKGRDSLRLFFIPGMDHCRGGAGCDTFEKLGTMEQWVENGKAPEQILASKVINGKVVRTRPLCAYPKVAKYKGTGDINDAGNFVCADPLP